MNQQVQEVEVRVNETRYVTFRCSKHTPISSFVKQLTDLAFIPEGCTEKDLKFLSQDKSKEYVPNDTVSKFTEAVVIVEYDSQKFPYTFENDQDRSDEEREA